MLRITDPKKANTAIELTVMDDQQREKKAVLLIDTKDNWGENRNNEIDIISFFASVLMKAAQTDNTAHLMQATCFKITGTTIRKAFDFSPMLRQDEDFKTVFISKNGVVEFI